MNKKTRSVIFLLVVSLSVVSACETPLFKSPTLSVTLTTPPKVTFTATATTTITPTPTKTITPTPTSSITLAPIVTDTFIPTLTNTAIPAPFSVMTILPDLDLQFHYNFHGGINEAGILEGITNVDFDRLFNIEECELKPRLTNDYLLLFHEGGSKGDNTIDECKIEFNEKVSDNFFDKEIKLVRVQFSLSYGALGTGEDKRIISYHFYPDNSYLKNWMFHESQFFFMFKCHNGWNDPTKNEVKYSNGLMSFFKTVGSADPVNLFHINLNKELSSFDILEKNSSATQVFILNYEPRVDRKDVKLYRLPELNYRIAEFDPRLLRFESDEEIRNNEGEVIGGFNCIYPVPDSFGIKLVGDSGIELRIYDIYIVTGPGSN